jgi:bifunctional UDP-N-acetylglucosamine pyrophosphorylase / glucosamine-1-phosphate N-acetyltransferase
MRSQLASRQDLQFAQQEPQLGTAHAVMQAEPLLASASGTMLLLSGDVPLLSTRTLQGLLQAHHAAHAAATVLTAMLDRPYGYGRIVRSHGEVARIVEERDASPAERAIREINAGVYAFDLEPLFPALRSIASQNAQGEYYLTDLVAIYRRRRLVVASETVANATEIRGINSRTELAEVGALVRQKKNEELMAAGVTLVDPATTYVDPDVIVGADTVIHPNVYLEGHTTVGAACEIHAGVRIVDATIGDRVTILNYTVITDSTVEAEVRLGPFAHLRPGSEVGRAAHVGNFVELKKTALGAGSKASHLTYLGDATIGEGVNIGAGTITCNYDGVHKNPTVIEDGAFIGSDSQLVAPVRVGKGAYVAAGSSIVEDVPAGSLGIARGRQANVEGWVARKKAARAAAADSAEPGSNPASRKG